MDYRDEIRSAATDPQRLEELYRGAKSVQEAECFRTAIDACYEQSPENLLYAAWYYRLTSAAAEERAALPTVNWKLAIPLSLAAGLLLWLLSDPAAVFPSGEPVLMALWAPVEAVCVLVFLLGSAGRPLRTYLPTLLGLAGLTAVALAFTWWPTHDQYGVLMFIHLPLVAWSAVGLSLLGWQSRHPNRFAFLYKSLEVFATGAIFCGAVGLFAVITSGLFQALGINLSQAMIRLLVVGGVRAIPVLAVASTYDPRLDPLRQQVESGLGRLIPTVMWLLLPLSLVVGAIYLLAIPFNFMGPFRSRQLLIVYNVLLFAVLALLVGATPVTEANLPARLRKPLRTGILALAAMAIVVSVYALSATLYRTLQDALTPNRLTVIGWNVVNVSILAVMVYRMVKRGAHGWIESVHSAIGQGTMAYIGWTAFLVLALPLWFR
ncbi:MAG: hypothetical protein AMJ93_10500 [Anaerolineae bacterium SM23_84]|nr:MAG: hypothetical protein AMJ93_10500 [Anaerolineae bacterium SM23_84]